jgi:hypothetical protein|tara:strand:- start:1475 stop:1954 length:480 start_codon:yes stop_codon:yes gene_type:complete
MASRVIDTLITYRVIKLMVTPWEKQEAFARGIIDDKGKVLRRNKTLRDSKDKKAYTYLHRFVFNLKRIMQKVGLGSKLGRFGAALALLLREQPEYCKHKLIIEAAVIKYLKDEGLYENMLNECKDIKRPNAYPIMTCFGIDIYEKGNELVSEMEYDNYI